MSFYIYILNHHSGFYPLMVLSSKYQGLPKNKKLQVPNWIAWLEWNAWPEVETSYNSVLSKYGQLPIFLHQRDSNPQPKDYQTDALDHIANGFLFMYHQIILSGVLLVSRVQCTPEIQIVPFNFQILSTDFVFKLCSFNIYFNGSIIF